MDPVVDIVYGVGVLLTVLKSVRINSGWSKIYMWTQRSTFYDARELSYTLKYQPGLDQEWHGDRQGPHHCPQQEVHDRLVELP